MDFPRESRELMKTLADADPAAHTACSEWTVHDLVAHLAAGAKENADLIEDALAGRPARATRTFTEREPAFVAMPDEHLRQELIHQSRRKLAALEELSDRGPDATYQFTGRPFSAALAYTHGRSEAAGHNAMTTSLTVTPAAFFTALTCERQLPNAQRRCGPMFLLNGVGGAISGGAVRMTSRSWRNRNRRPACSQGRAARLPAAGNERTSA